MPSPSKAKVKKASPPFTGLSLEVYFQIERLRELRRKLCCYAAPHSDKMCDCKYLEDIDSKPNAFRMAGMSDRVKHRTGEQTGCCEVRMAISQLELVLASFKEPERLPCGELKGKYGNCAKCSIPFMDPSAAMAWREDGKVIDVCCTCNEKLLKDYHKRRITKNKTY